MNQENKFHDNLKRAMDEYANRVYDCTQGFPKEEMYGITSQLRRSALSVVLNYIEGYARRRKKVSRDYYQANFYQKLLILFITLFENGCDPQLRKKLLPILRHN